MLVPMAVIIDFQTLEAVDFWITRGRGTYLNVSTNQSGHSHKKAVIR